MEGAVLESPVVPITSIVLSYLLWVIVALGTACLCFKIYRHFVSRPKKRGASMSVSCPSDE